MTPYLYETSPTPWGRSLSKETVLYEYLSECVEVVKMLHISVSHAYKMCFRICIMQKVYMQLFEALLGEVLMKNVPGSFIQTEGCCHVVDN